MRVGGGIDVLVLVFVYEVQQANDSHPPHGSTRNYCQVRQMREEKPNRMYIRSHNIHPNSCIILFIYTFFMITRHLVTFVSMKDSFYVILL